MNASINAVYVEIEIENATLGADAKGRMASSTAAARARWRERHSTNVSGQPCVPASGRGLLSAWSLQVRQFLLRRRLPVPSAGAPIRMTAEQDDCRAPKNPATAAFILIRLVHIPAKRRGRSRSRFSTGKRRKTAPFSLLEASMPSLRRSARRVRAVCSRRPAIT